MELCYNSRKKGEVKRTGKLESEKAQAVEACLGRDMEIEKLNYTNRTLIIMQSLDL